MNGRIAFFDFDGTITTKDSLLEFIKYCKGSVAFYSGFILFSPVIVAFKLKIISNQAAKEMMMWHFFGNMTTEKFNGLCTKFNAEVMPSLIRKKALLEIQLLKSQGAEVVVVSASPENWLMHWCHSMELKCIATRMIIVNDKITGKINGNNCYGEEKVRRIQEQYDLSTFSSVYCYGDTPGDRPMLALGNIRFYKPFR